MIGVVYIAYGLRARQEVAQAAQYLRRHHDWPVTVIGERVDGEQCIAFEDPGAGRWAKVNLDQLSPYDPTIYLDADTRVHGDIGSLVHILADGWDVVMVPSTKQETDALWHIDEEERAATFSEVGRNPVQLQGGVIAFRKTETVKALFEAWRTEWQRWRGQDQGALLRALHQCPVKLWLLDNDYNGGALIEHRYGAARRRDGEV